MSIIGHAIANNQLFRSLTPDEASRVSKLIFLRSYRAGRTLFYENTPGEVMYLIHSGRAGILKANQDGQEVTLATLETGDFFGEMSLVDDRPRSATARVLDDAELVVITKKAFDQMLETDPVIASKLLLALLKVVYQRLRATDDRFKTLVVS